MCDRGIHLTGLASIGQGLRVWLLIVLCLISGAVSVGCLRGGSRCCQVWPGRGCSVRTRTGCGSDGTKGSAGPHGCTTSPTGGVAAATLGAALVFSGLAGAVWWYPGCRHGRWRLWHRSGPYHDAMSAQPAEHPEGTLDRSGSSGNCPTESARTSSPPTGKPWKVREIQPDGDICGASCGSGAE